MDATLTDISGFKWERWHQWSPIQTRSYWFFILATGGWQKQIMDSVEPREVINCGCLKKRFYGFLDDLEHLMGYD